MDETTADFRWAARARETLAPTRPAGAHDDVIQLGGGYGFPDTLPDIVAEAMAAAGAKTETLQYGPIYGLDELRDAIVAYLAQDGISASRDNILVVNGAKHGLDLACRVFLEPGDGVIIAAPTYLTAVHILRNAEASFVSVTQDENGLDTDALERVLQRRRDAGQRMPKLLFDIPDFHNPTGITMSAARRQALVELANRYDFVIIEDDPYRRVRFEGTPVPPIKTFDTSGRVIGLGTVSKILAPGLRVGWVNGPPAIIRRMAAHKSDYGTCPLLQRIVVQLLQNGAVNRHIATLSTVLRTHRDAMISAICAHLPGTTVRTPMGGYFLWVQLPPEIDADELVRRSAQAGVAIFSGKLSFAESASGQFLRLAYSFCTPARIAEGVARIGRAYADMQTEATGHRVEAA